MYTLLEKAKKLNFKKPTQKTFSDEEVELAIAWIKGEVTTSQATKALESDNKVNYPYTVTIVMKYIYKQGKIKFE